MARCSFINLDSVCSLAKYQVHPLAERSRDNLSLVTRPTPQQRMDYITNTPRSGDVIHPLLWRGSGYETKILSLVRPRITQNEVRLYRKGHMERSEKMTLVDFSSFQFYY